MTEDWSSLMGECQPTGWSDLKLALQRALQLKLIYLDKKSLSHISEVAQQLWDNYKEDPDRIINLINSAIKGKKNEKYLLGGSLNESSFRKKDAYQPNKPVQVSSIKEEVKQVRSDGNWDKVYFDEYEHWTWKDPRHWPAKLWTELAHKFPRPYDRKIYIDGHSYILEAGKIVITERQMARLYGTTKTQIHTLLVKLEADKMISRLSIPRWKKQQPYDGPQPGPYDGPSEKPSVQPRELSSVTLITICNYWKYHTKVLLPDVANKPSKKPSVQPQPGPYDGPVPGPQIIELINKEEQKTTTPPTPSLFAVNELYEIFNSEKGPLTVDSVRQPEKLRPLVEWLNSLKEDPREKYKQLVRKMAQCHPSHRKLMSPWFLAKDLNHINQLEKGLYDEPFERGNNGKSKVVERLGKGNASEYGAKTENAVERLKRVSAISDATAVPKV
jgi:hypothetical protein